MTVYVLEGPDGAGKTTLGHLIEDHLSREGSVATFHNGKPPEGEDLFSHYLRQIGHARTQSDFAIIDRLHIGELIYGPYYRGVSRLSDHQANALDAHLDSIDAVKIYVTAPTKVLWERISERGDGLVKSVTEVSMLKYRYENLIGRGGIYKNWIQWDSMQQGRIFK